MAESIWFRSEDVMRMFRSYKPLFRSEVGVMRSWTTTAWFLAGQELKTTC